MVRFLFSCWLGLLVSFVTACRTDEVYIFLKDDLSDAGDGVNTVYSCQYHNKHAGMDCKEFIGEVFQDAKVREDNCGTKFFEEDAVLLEEPCPDAMEIDGVTRQAKGVCHAKRGQPDEYALYSYEAELTVLETACSSFVKGEWEAFIEEDTNQEIFELLPEALVALDSTDTVTVSSSCKEADCLAEMVAKGETFDFMPNGKEPTAGFVLYPGGNVDPRAYAPAAMAIAEAGIFVSIVPMENYLAITGVMRAEDVLATYPSIQKWFVGGHSLGGAMAARYGALSGATTIDGVIIWASVADTEDDLSQTSLAVLTIYASLDAGLTPAEVMQYASALPEDAVFVCIDGGDHSQFGFYLDEDSSAEITREDQQQQVVASTARFIQNPTSVKSVVCGN